MQVAEGRKCGSPKAGNAGSQQEMQVAEGRKCRSPKARNAGSQQEMQVAEVGNAGRRGWAGGTDPADASGGYSPTPSLPPLPLARWSCLSDLPTGNTFPCTHLIARSLSSSPSSSRQGCFLSEPSRFYLPRAVWFSSSVFYSTRV